MSLRHLLFYRMPSSSTSSSYIAPLVCTCGYIRSFGYMQYVCLTFSWQFLNYAYIYTWLWIKIKSFHHSSTIITTFAHIIFLFTLPSLWHFPLWHCFQLNVNALQSSKIFQHKKQSFFFLVFFFHKVYEAGRDKWAYFGYVFVCVLACVKRQKRKSREIIDFSFQKPQFMLH